jgi:hypothetical protein
MPITTLEKVAQYISDITPEQIGKCHHMIGPDGKSLYAVENERGDIGLDGEVIEYCVRYSPERGFSCTCPSGAQGFANVRHPSGVCKHCRWTVAAIIEERGYYAELAAAEESRRQAEEATQAERPAPSQERPDWYNPTNETSYFDGTRAHLLLTGRLEADDMTYTRVVLAKPKHPSEAEIRRDQARFAPRPFTIL